MINKKSIKKLYYSIREVSEMTDLKQYVLRYWETEFPVLKPSKNRAGNRIYRDKDIKLINRIKQLLYDEKFTIDGARKKLQDESESISPSDQMQLDFRTKGDVNPKQILQEVKEDLLTALDLLENRT